MPFRNQERGKNRWHDDMRQQAAKLPHTHRDNDGPAFQRPPHHFIRIAGISLFGPDSLTIRETLSLSRNCSSSTTLHVDSDKYISIVLDVWNQSKPFWHWGHWRSPLG